MRKKKWVARCGEWEGGLFAEVIQAEQGTPQFITSGKPGARFYQFDAASRAEAVGWLVAKLKSEKAKASARVFEINVMAAIAEYEKGEMKP
jgi:hypothetical protein